MPFHLFVKYIKYHQPNNNLSSNKLQVDRINNDGNYERYNLKLSTLMEQNHNKRVRNDSTTGYKGVSKAVNSPRYRSYLYQNNKHISIGIFDTIKEALEARNQYIKQNNLPHQIQIYVDN